MRLLVTGGWGYVGAAVCALLRREGIAHTVCDAGWFAGAAQREADGPARDIRTLTRDDLAGFDAIIHLAGLSNDPLGALDPADTAAINHRATTDLAQAARAAGVGAFVFASTASVYGAAGATNLDEFAPTRPITPYAAAKRAAEHDLLGLHGEGLRVAILRGATAYGWTDCPRTDLLLNEFAALAALGRPLVLTSDGAAWRPFMPVADFARALVGAALTPPEADDGLPIWNIAPPALQMTVAQAVRRAAAATGAPEPRFGSARPADLRSYRINGSRFARAWPGSAYSDDFDSTMRACVSGFAAMPTLAQDMARGRYVRLSMLDRALPGGGAARMQA